MSINPDQLLLQSSSIHNWLALTNPLAVMFPRTVILSVGVLVPNPTRSFCSLNNTNVPDLFQAVEFTFPLIALILAVVLIRHIMARRP